MSTDLLAALRLALPYVQNVATRGHKMLKYMAFLGYLRQAVAPP